MKSRGTVATLLRIFPYAKSALPRIILGTIAALGAHLFALSIPQFLRSLVNGLKTNGSVETLVPAVITVLVFGLLEASMVLLRRWLVLTPGTKVEAGLRRTLYAKLQDLPVSFHDKWPSGQLLSRVTGDLSLIRRWLSFGLVLFVANSITIIVGLGVLFTFHWILGLLFFITSVPIWVRGFRFEKEYHAIARKSQDQAGDLATSIEESVHGIRVLKAFGRGGFFADKFANDAWSLRATELKKAGLIANIWVYLILIPEIAVGLSMLVGVWLVANGQLTVGGLVAFFATTTVLRWPTESVGFLLSMTLDAKTAVERFFEVLDAPIEIEDPAQPKSVSQPKGRLVFKDVHFRYADAPESQPDLLNGIDLTLEPGESVALIGMPEGRIALSETTIYLALAPKSNSAYNAINRAIDDVKSGLVVEVPSHLRSSNYAGAESYGNGKGYKYPHDEPGAIVNQLYVDSTIAARGYYQPKNFGTESDKASLWERLRKIIRGK